MKFYFSTYITIPKQIPGIPIHKNTTSLVTDNYIVLIMDMRDLLQINCYIILKMIIFEN